MNQTHQLLKALVNVFGMGKIIRSRFKKLRQGFEGKTNENVFIIEYWTLVEGTLRGQPRVNPYLRKTRIIRHLLARPNSK